MLDPIEIRDKSPLLRRAIVRRRQLTLVITSLAVFAVAMLLWPLNVRGYLSEAQIELVGIDDVQRQAMLDQRLPSVLRTLLEPTALIATLADVQQAVPLRSRHLASGDVQRVGAHLSIGLRPASGNQASQLRVAFLGDGYADEQRLVEVIAAQIGVGLARLNRQDSNIAAPCSSVPTRMTTFQKLDRAEWLVGQIEEGLTAAKDQTVQLIANAQPVETPSAFRSIGHVRVVSGNEVDSLHRTLDSVDIASLKGMIGQMKQSPDGGAATRFTAAPVTQTPLGAIPTRATVLLLGMVSLLVGSVVALNISPFTEFGFQNANEVAETLGVPVIATFPLAAITREAAGDSLPTQFAVDQNSRQTWANQVSTLASTVLMALVILVVGFWLLYPSVRDAFGQSVWHGVARIVWTFTG